MGGKLYRHLRQCNKRYRRGRKEKAPAIKNAVSIDDRPSIVDSKERLGDWEIDTVLGKHGTGAMMTILERKTRFYVVKKVPSKSADDVTKATIELLMPYQEHVHTITADNGREFAGHETIAKALEADVYFAHPYSSWERGANENANGLLRQYVKKGTDLTTVTVSDIEFVISRINYRPDVSMNEDACQIYKDHGAENLACLRHMSLNMLREEPTKLSIGKQKRCMMNTSMLEAVLTLVLIAWLKIKHSCGRPGCASTLN